MPAKRARKPAKGGRASSARSTRRSGSNLSKKQLAQRKYAGKMAGVRKRAKKAAGGQGPIKKRGAAATLRRMLGLGS